MSERRPPDTVRAGEPETGLMDIRRIDADPTRDERAAVDALLGAPRSSWDGGAAGQPARRARRDVGGRDSRAMRHLLLPALRALQARVGWISEGGLGYICDRLERAACRCVGRRDVLRAARDRAATQACRARLRRHRMQVQGGGRGDG